MMADGSSSKSSQHSSSAPNHTRSISLPNPLSLIPIRGESTRYSHDDTDAGEGSDSSGLNFLDNLIAIGQAAVEAANRQEGNHTEDDDDDEEGSDSEQGHDETTQAMNANGSSDSGETHTNTPKDPLTVGSKTHSPDSSGSIKGSDSDANYSLSCPVCLENYYRPHMCLPCKHTFCEPCLCRLRKADINHPTKCPLCREKIRKCTFDHALASSVSRQFPEVYQLRHKQEKKQKYKLPPLPGIPITMDGYGRNMLATWSAVCAVVLLMMFIFTVFTSFVGFVLWYTIEVGLDVVGELLIEASDFFSFSWQALIILWIEGKVPQEIQEILSGSARRIGSTMSRLVNRTQAFFSDGELPPPQVPVYVKLEHASTNDSTTELLTKMTQVNVANYVLLAGVFTYFLYRLARYFQNGHNAQQVPRVPPVAPQQPLDGFQ